MDDSSFEALADATLERLFQAVDAAAGDAVDVDLQGGILTLELESGAQYVINKHAPNRQIWLSSPQSGAWHFNHDPASGDWVSSRGDERLGELLRRELADATGADLAFG